MGKRPWLAWTRPLRRSECATAATDHQTIPARPPGRDPGGQALTVEPSTDPRDPRRTQRRHAGARHLRLRPQRLPGRSKRHTPSSAGPSTASLHSAAPRSPSPAGATTSTSRRASSSTPAPVRTRSRPPSPASASSTRMSSPAPMTRSNWRSAPGSSSSATCLKPSAEPGAYFGYLPGDATPDPQRQHAGRRAPRATLAAAHRRAGLRRRRSRGGTVTRSAASGRTASWPLRRTTESLTGSTASTPATCWTAC